MTLKSLLEVVLECVWMVLFKSITEELVDKMCRSYLLMKQEANCGWYDWVFHKGHYEISIISSVLATSCFTVVVVFEWVRIGSSTLVGKVARDSACWGNRMLFVLLWSGLRGKRTHRERRGQKDRSAHFVCRQKFALLCLNSDCSRRFFHDVESQASYLVILFLFRSSKFELKFQRPFRS